MKKLFAFALLAVCLMLTSCRSSYNEDTFFSMDTLVTVRADGGMSVLGDCRSLLAELEACLSSHTAGGQTEIYNLSDKGAELSEHAIELIGISQGITDRTKGEFSVFAGGLVSLWSESTELPEIGQIEKALDSICFDPVFDGDFLKKENADTRLEFGGIAKGYACDKAVALMKNSGVSSGMISFSSSIGVLGGKADGSPWKIAVKDPFDTSKNIGVIALSDGFLSVSGDYERQYEINGKRYNHIIDLKSGCPVDNGVHSVVVIAPSGAESDALSTAFFVMGPEGAEEYTVGTDIKYLIITDDGLFMNDGMKALFTEAN